MAHMTLKQFLAKMEAELKSLAHLTFLKAAARQAISNGLDAAFAAASTGTPEARVIADVNAFIERVTGHMGPIVSTVAGIGEIGIDEAIHAAFAQYGSTASEDELKSYIFAHLGV